MVVFVILGGMSMCIVCYYLPDTAGFGNLHRSDRKKNLKGFRSQPIISRDYTS